MYKRQEIYEAEGSNKKAELYQEKMNYAMDTFFPVVHVKRKSSDDPWMNMRILKKMKQRKAVFRLQGRSRRWKKLKKRSNRMINEARARYTLRDTKS